MPSSATCIRVSLTYIALVLCAPAFADPLPMSTDFSGGRYEAARQQLGQDSLTWRPGEELLWRVRLATDVDAALALLDAARQDDELPAAVRIRLDIEAADIEFARGNHSEVLTILEPWLHGGDADVPGGAYLRAALALRALGQGQQARELLASVRPSDPSFATARYYLGDIALEQGDATLALRYLEGAAEAWGGRDAVAAAGARWRALLAAGDTLAAGQIQADLTGRHFDSLSHLEVLKGEVAGGITAPPEAPSPADIDASGGGRFCLQFGAFSDRSLALAFQRRHRRTISDLRIDRARDDRGHYVYKVRSGSYNNPALARTEAVRIRETHQLEVFVSEIDSGGQSSR